MSKHPKGWMSPHPFLQTEERQFIEMKDSIELQRCPWKDCNKIGCKKPWHKPSTFAKTGFVKRMRPVVVWVGVSEIIIGTILAIFVIKYADNIDKFFGKEESKIISLLSFGGLVTLAVSGMILLISVLLNRRGIMWFYVLLSTFLCIYIFVLSVLMINFAMAIVKEEPIKNKEVLNNPCILGLVTLFGSVVHFVGTVSVFTYYNLKYIHPIMFNCPGE